MAGGEDQAAGRDDQWSGFAPPVVGGAPSGMPLSPPVVFEAPTATVLEAPGGIAPAAPRRGRGKVVGGIVAVAALLGAGGFAVAKIASGNDGGASSPAAVGNQLMDSLGKEDALGVVDLLLPGERDTFRQPLIDLVDNLKRLHVADDSASLAKVGGLDFSFTDVKVDAQPTNLDDITNVHITGSGTASVNGKDVPIGDLLIDEAFGGKRPNMDSAPQTSDVDWHITTVKQDGRWYLSAMYSIAESARPDDVDIPDAGVVPHGADSPDGAVQSLLDAVADLDLEGMVASLDPAEAAALQRYAPIFIDDAQKQLDDVKVKLEISDVTYSVSGSGDRRTVGITGFKVHVQADDQDVTVQRSDNGCTTVDVAGQDPLKMCNDGSTSFDKMFGDLGVSMTPEYKDFIDKVQKAFDDVGPLGIAVHQVDGKWYVSPVRTYVDMILAVMKALDDNELRDIIDSGKKLAQAGPIAGFPFDGSTDTSGGDTSGSDTSTPDSSGMDRCYAADTYDAFQQCVTDGMQDGSIDASVVMPYYRFADCGVGQPYWDGSVYSMSDADFTAFAEKAAPCFQKYVDDGTIFRFELPYELSRPECLEGKNWYNASDTDYSQRVFECATK